VQIASDDRHRGLPAVRAAQPVLVPVPVLVWELVLPRLVLVRVHPIPGRRSVVPVLPTLHLAAAGGQIVGVLAVGR
jgi:hypothetical protein